MSKNEIELKITTDSKGIPMSLKTLSAKAADAFAVLIQSLAKISELTSEGSEISLEIREGSCVVASKMLPAQIIKIETELEKVISGKSNYEELIIPLRNVQNIITANGLSYEVNLFKDGVKLPILNKFKGQPKFRVNNVKVEPQYKLHFLVGELNNIGGNKPNFHFVKDSTDRITVNCDESEAIRLRKYLYKKIQISVWSNTKSPDEITYQFCDLYIKSSVFERFSNFHKTYALSEGTDKLKKVHYALKEILDKKVYTTANKFIKTFCHKSIDIGTLRTILVITKSFQNERNLKVNRKIIKDLIETEIGKLY